MYRAGNDKASIANKSSICIGRRKMDISVDKSHKEDCAHNCSYLGANKTMCPVELGLPKKRFL
jgi:hypothetical protein